MNELPPSVKSLLERGDPAVDVTPQLVARVAERLSTPISSRTRWRPLVLIFALLASAALGSVATVAIVRFAPGLIGAQPPSPLPPTRDDALSREAALLHRALEALNGHQPARALELLDERARLFPAGLLEAEARVTRVRALLELGDADASLRLLERLPPADVTPALRLSWARTLVERGGCEAARKVVAPLQTTEPELVRVTLGECLKGTRP